MPKIVTTSRRVAPAPVNRSGLGYIPGLDGIRAIAVLAVIVYHANPGTDRINPGVSWLPAGYLGVDMFFVLSGYLITSLLLIEWRNTNKIRFGNFYLRRARRLLPALFVMLVGATLLALVLGRDAIPGIRRDMPGALLYVQNWWQLTHHLSYFAAVGRPPLLQHLWSLAIEEQFYLIWPLVFTLGLKRWGSRSTKLVGTVLAGAVLSTILMALLSHQSAANNFDASNVYLATHTHMMGLLIGATLALVWRRWQLSKKVPPSAPLMLDAVGLIALAWVIYIMANTGTFATWIYARGGFLFFSVLVAVVIASVVHPAGHLNALLGVQPLKWIGERSYGIYLWHWPIMMLTRPDTDQSLVHGVWLWGLQLTATLFIANLSYHYVEMPIRQGAIGKFVKRMREADGEERERLRQRRLRVLGASLSAFVIATVGLLAVNETDRLAAAESANKASDLKKLLNPKHTAATATSTSTTASTASTVAVDPNASTTTTAAPTTTTLAPGTYSTLALGDSVMLGAANVLRATLGEATTAVDAQVSRSSGNMVAIVQELQRAAALPPVVVIHTGTNGVVTVGQLDALFAALKDVRRVVILNLRVPRSWEPNNNAVIRDVSARYPNVRFVDWHAEGNAHPEWFTKDGFHVEKSGQEAYARLVKDAINAP